MPTAKKAPSKSVPAKKTAGLQDAVQLLTADHREVKTLFDNYKKLAKSKSAGSERQLLAETICDMLTVHATIEEEIFYPAAREALGGEEDQDLLDEAEVEHASARELISQLKAMQPDDDLYDAKVTVLGEYIDHHVQEEEKEMFPKAKKSGMSLDEVGAQLRGRKSELLTEFAEFAAK